MAYIMQLTQPTRFQKLTSIMNVSQTVGPVAEGGQNLQNDVDAVEKLMLLWSSNPEDGCNITNNGLFDPVTGYSIFRLQQKMKKDGYPNQIVDGIISPAKSLVYGSGTVYTIVALNEKAAKLNPAGYADFMSMKTFRPTG
jgi:hypothetical protein